MNLADNLSPKTILALLYIVVALEIAGLQIYLQVDNIVNVDLYQYGLQFSIVWAADYWMNFRLALACLLGATAVMGATLIPYYTYSKENTVASRWSCIIFPLISASLAAISMYFIFQIDSIVNVTLYQNGLQLSPNWIENYWLFTRLTLAMAGTGIIIPAIMALSTWDLTKD